MSSFCRVVIAQGGNGAEQMRGISEVSVLQTGRLGATVECDGWIYTFVKIVL